MEELIVQLKAMTNDKCAYTRGIVAEPLKHAGDSILDIIVMFFRDVLQVGVDTPEYWKESRLKVLLKKGDPKAPSNYRPVSILPIL